ncbi:MAG TPA: helix-turn-helix transcriptional regulator [Candidatus Fermentibacter daniensis]|nr:helix-turn-helix transcriptional regulator [Candidatus Fermentibacter daniensis]HPH40194.1 helix-turn-helix transcriptional regulator [Candidatus Fermentibacter daniensis]HPN63072.1 helix-turn-helix transcriptional regulator [Candidatus Fermentibacter daniensis]
MKDPKVIVTEQGVAEMTRTRKDREYNKVFGPHIRKVRQEKFPDMTVSDFADSVGITGPYLSKIENSKVPPPSEPTVKAIAEKLGEDTDSLLLMAGYVDLSLIGDLGKIDEKQMGILKLIKFMRSVADGSSAKFTTEQIIGYMMGRQMEENRKLTAKEMISELISALSYATDNDDQFAEELQPTIDRGLRVLGPVLEQMEAQRAEAEKKHESKAKRR